MLVVDQDFTIERQAHRLRQDWDRGPQASIDLMRTFFNALASSSSEVEIRIAVHCRVDDLVAAYENSKLRAANDAQVREPRVFQFDQASDYWQPGGLGTLNSL